jgi:hypothetical protein
VSESLDGTCILVGEAKWATRQDVPRWRAELRARAASAPFVGGRRVVTALWLKEGPENDDVLLPEQVLGALR